jgi:hypothetical protein
VSGQGACKCRITVRKEPVGFVIEKLVLTDHFPMERELVTRIVLAEYYGTGYVRVYIGAPL